MKPCSNQRKRIAWLALDALDAREERALRAHLESCNKCRRYLEEISNLTEKLAATEIRSDFETSESFHQKVVSALRAEEKVSAWETVVAQLPTSLLNWFTSLSSSVEERAGVRSRVLALFVIGATAMMVVALSLFLRRPGVPSPAPTDSQAMAISTPAIKSDLDPSISNYQIIANRSLEKLDELLTSQGNRNPSPAPIYTASTLARVSGVD